MINRLIEWSLRNRFLVVCGALFLIGWGIRSRLSHARWMPSPT